MSKRFLKEGDIVELKQGHTVYAEIPNHFAYPGDVGNFELTTTEVPVCSNVNGLNTIYLGGKYVVVKTEYGGGSSSAGYPDGHSVTCQKMWSKDRILKVSFYQSGCFTTRIKPEDIEIVGKAELTYRVKK